MKSHENSNHLQYIDNHQAIAQNFIDYDDIFMSTLGDESKHEYEDNEPDKDNV